MTTCKMIFLICGRVEIRMVSGSEKLVLGMLDSGKEPVQFKEKNEIALV
jgi:hypothetical protein